MLLLKWFSACRAWTARCSVRQSCSSGFQAQVPLCLMTSIPESMCARHRVPSCSLQPPKAAHASTAEVTPQFRGTSGLRDVRLKGREDSRFSGAIKMVRQTGKKITSSVSGSSEQLNRVRQRQSQSCVAFSS